MENEIYPIGNEHLRKERIVPISPKILDMAENEIPVSELSYHPNPVLLQSQNLNLDEVLGCQKPYEESGFLNTPKIIPTKKMKREDSYKNNF